MRVSGHLHPSEREAVREQEEQRKVCCSKVVACWNIVYEAIKKCIASVCCSRRLTAAAATQNRLAHRNPEPENPIPPQPREHGFYRRPRRMRIIPPVYRQSECKRRE